MTGLEAVAFHLAADALIWGYPAIKFEQLMRGRSRPEIVALGQPQAAVNQFGLVRELRGAEYKQIATPNNDTLYAQAFCDVSREPLVLTVPAIDAERYMSFQLWDPNGDTIGYVGTRVTGRGRGDFALVGPGWVGELPTGVERIDCPYNGLVVWGRIGVSGPDDLANAIAIQDQLRLTPLSQFGSTAQQVPPDLEFSDERVRLDIPDDLPDDLRIYAELANALRFTPPKDPQDAVVAASLSSIGFRDGNTRFDPSSLTEQERQGLVKGARFALHLMDVNAQTTGERVNGWRWSPKSGIMGADYLFRAAFAKWFTGGNAPEEAIYLDGRFDSNGEPLTGSRRYTMHFAPGELPPVEAFWSISMYHISDGSFVANPIDRYTIGDRTLGIQANADQSLTVIIQHDAPADPNELANWLPAPSDEFYLNLRLYIPDDSLPTGKWAPPPVTPR